MTLAKNTFDEAPNHTARLPTLAEDNTSCIVYVPTIASLLRSIIKAGGRKATAPGRAGLRCSYEAGGREGRQVLPAVYFVGGSWSATSCPTNRGQRAECEGEGKDEVVDVFMKGKLDILAMLETKREAHNGRSSIPGDARPKR